MHGILTGARSGKAPLFAWNGKRTLVTIGDSKTAQGTSTAVSGANTIWRYHSNGYQHHLLGLLHQRLHFGPANNLAVGGHTSAQQLAVFEAGAVAAHAPGFVIVEVGTNDVVAADASADAVLANIVAMCRHNRLIGAYTILSTISVRGSGNGSGWGGLTATNAIARRNRLNQINRRILELDLPGVFPVDVNRYWADPASATGDPRSGYTTDSLHDSVAGAYWRAKAYANVIDAILPPSMARGLSMPTQADIYDATNNPKGNLLSGAFMSGTGGTLPAGGSGSVPTSFSFARAAGTTPATCAVQDRADGLGREFVASWTAASGNAREAFEFGQTINAAAGVVVPGDTLVGELEMVLSESQNLTAAFLLVQDGNTGVSGNIQGQAYDGALYADTAYIPGEARTVRFRTPPLTILAGMTSVKWVAGLYFNGSVAPQTLSIRFRDVSLRKV